MKNILTKQIFSIILVGFVYNCNAQITPTLIDIGNYDNLTDVVELNSTYYLNGSTYVYGESKAVVVKYHDADNYTYQVFALPDSTFSISGMVNYANRLFVTGCIASKEETNTSKLLIGEIDTNMNFIWRKSIAFEEQPSKYGGSQLIAKDNRLYVSGSVQEEGDYSNAIISSFSLSGIPINYYRFENLNSKIQDMTYSSDTSMLLAVGRFFDPTLVGGPNYAQLSFDLDSVFMEGIYSTPLGDLLSIKPDSDSTYILGSIIDEYSLPNGNVGFEQHSLRRLDAEFNATILTHQGEIGIDDDPAWCNSIDFITPDTIYYALGHDHLYNPPYDHPKQLWIGYTNNQLEPLQQYKLGNENDYYEPFTIFATKDGGCIVAGYYISLSDPAENKYMFIVKLDAGMIGTTLENTSVNLKSNVQTSPNPAQNEMHFSMDGNYGVCQVKIYNLQGKVVYHNQLSGNEFQISCKDWNSGMYLYTIHNQDGVFATGKIMKQ